MQSAWNIGVDVAKKEVVAACYEGSFSPCHLANTGSNLNRWLSGLPQGCRIAMEASGGYQRLLAELAYRHGHEVFVLNAKDVHHYAKAMGMRGKTDRVDAQIIARYLAHERARLRPWHPPLQANEHIDALLKRRALVTEQRGRLMASMRAFTELAQPLQNALASLQALIAAIDQELDQLLAQDPQRQLRCQTLQTVTGFGPVVSTALTNLFERVPFNRSDAVVAFSGLDPRPADSGQRQGRRRLSKRGPAELRRLLFIAAMAACTSKTFRPYYQALLQKGFATTQALVILARKLLRIGFAIYKSGTPFDSTRFAKA